MLKNRYDVLPVHVRVVHLNHRQFHQMTAKNERLRDIFFPLPDKTRKLKPGQKLKIRENQVFSLTYISLSNHKPTIPAKQFRISLSPFGCPFDCAQGYGLFRAG